MRSDNRAPKVVLAEAAPAALAAANTGRSPRLKPHRHCRSGSVTQPARRPPRPNEHSSRPARAAHAPAQRSEWRTLPPVAGRRRPGRPGELPMRQSRRPVPSGRCREGPPPRNAPTASAAPTQRGKEAPGRLKPPERQPCSMLQFAWVKPPSVGSRTTSRSRIGASFVSSVLMRSSSSSSEASSATLALMSPASFTAESWA